MVTLLAYISVLMIPARHQHKLLRSGWSDPRGIFFEKIKLYLYFQGHCGHNIFTGHIEPLDLDIFEDTVAVT